MPAAPLPNRFLALDTMRGLAALFVAVYHTVPYLAVHWGAYVLVDFFLVLSGFVLAHSHLYRENAYGIGGFIWRRFTRLWPMHVVSLVLMWWVVYYGLTGKWFTEPYNNPTTLVQQVTMTHNLGLPLGTSSKYPGDAWSWNFPAWSVSVEFWVNVLFALFIRRRTRSWLLAATGFVCLAVVFQAKHTLGTYNFNLYDSFFPRTEGMEGSYRPNPFKNWNSGMLRGIASFVLGILSYRLYRRWHAAGLRVTGATLWEGLAFLFFLALPNVALLTTETRDLRWIEFSGPLLFVPMVALYALQQGRLTRWLNKLEHLGTISYSLYLNHAMFIVLVNSIWGHAWLPAQNLVGRLPHNDFVTPALVLVGSLVWSHFTYHWVEMPAQRGLRRLFAAQGRK
ncbi:MAG: acyltransferase [Planctomycetota bacterium]